MEVNQSSAAEAAEKIRVQDEDSANNTLKTAYPFAGVAKPDVNVSLNIEKKLLYWSLILSSSARAEINKGEGWDLAKQKGVDSRSVFGFKI
jgi:hypothetical protein